MVMVCAAVVLQAKPVDKAVAARYAAQVLHKAVVDVTPQQFTECYLFVGVDNKGFALIAADDCVRPLLAYSLGGQWPVSSTPMPDPVAAWIDGYQREIASVVASGAVPSPVVQALWENPATRKSGNAVSPLLTTRWEQGSYYNLYCPYDTVDSAYCYTGCVATAMAQIMRYWEYPEIGWGEYSYTHPTYGIQSADFGHTHYRWERMPDTLNAACDSFQVDAVATLMYHAGVAVRMVYGINSSGAFDISRGTLNYPCAENAMKTYFRYNPMLSGNSKTSFSDTEWDSMLRSELDAARPVFYCGHHQGRAGHAFVLDGYDTMGMFHVNWGWGGYYDAYYTVDSLSPGAGSLGGNPIYTFNSNPVKALRAPTGTKGSYLHNFLTAFLVTFSNPLIILLFIGLFARFSFVSEGELVSETVTGYVSIVGGALLWWFMLTYGVNKVRKQFNLRGIWVLNRVIGVIVMIVAIVGMVITFLGESLY